MSGEEALCVHVVRAQVSSYRPNALKSARRNAEMRHKGRFLSSVLDPHSASLQST